MIESKVGTVSDDIDWETFSYDLYDKLWQFSQHYIDPKTLLAVREMFEDADEHSCDCAVDLSHLQFIAPWLFFDSDYIIRVKTEKSDMYNTLCSAFIANDKTLSSLEKDFMDQASKSPFSFYQVIQRTNHRAMRLENMLTGKVLEIANHFLFDFVQKGDIVFAKIIDLRSTPVIAGIAPDVFAKTDNKMILEFKQGLLEHFEEIDDIVLSLYKSDLLLIFDEMHSTQEEFNNAYY